MIKAILAVIALSLVLVSVTLPWLTITILGQFSFSPVDIIRFLTRNGSQASSTNVDPTQLMSSFPDTFVTLLLSTIAFPSAIIILIIASASSRLRMSALGSGGFSALTSAISWIYSIESLKAHAISEAASSGGFGQMFGTAIASAINIGIGPYLVIVAGIVSLAGYFLKGSITKKSLTA